ncbi:MAG: DUF2608 domain-containing protein [Pseudobdellovibrio sp.]
MRTGTFFITIFVIPFFCLASGKVDTLKIEDIEKVALEKIASVGSENVLVIYDIDNTLLAMNQDLGSDQWFNWQADLVKAKKFKFAAAKTFNDLLALQKKLFALSSMHPVQKDTSEIVKRIQQQKIQSIVLTSRGVELRSDTERELKKANIDFSKSAFGPANGYAETFFIEGDESSKPISFMNGIIMGSGQNKGKVLKAILQKAEIKFKVILFADDTVSNIENIENEFSKDVDLYTFHYTHEDKHIKAFEKNKSKAIHDWRRLRPVLSEIFHKNTEF